MSPSPMDWAPKAMPGALPSDAVFSDAPVVAYVSLNDAVFNFGHALFDFLFPVFNTLQLMDMYHSDFQLLLAEHQVSDPFCLPALDVCSTYHCTHTVTSLCAFYLLHFVGYSCMMLEHGALLLLDQPCCQLSTDSFTCCCCCCFFPS